MTSMIRHFKSACMNKQIAALFALLLLLPFAANAAGKKFVLVIDQDMAAKMLAHWALSRKKKT